MIDGPPAARAIDAPSPSLAAIAGKAWAFRHWVERDACARFARMARRLEGIGTPASLVQKAREASEDEARHAVHCAELAAHYGHALAPNDPEPRELAPERFSDRQRVLYEVAAACLAESESSVMLVTLMQHAHAPKMKAVLRELSRDEVEHARFGWAVLASHRATDDLSFLAGAIPWMLSTTAGDTFRPQTLGPEHDEIAEHGVLPYSLRRAVFIDALNDVVFPGLETLGIDAAPSRAWLAKLTAPET